MIIANSSPLTALTGSEMSGEGVIVEQTASQIEAQSVDIESLDQSVNEHDFWSMLNQQLAEISTVDEVQVIENKDLSKLPGFTEVDIDSDLPYGFMKRLDVKIIDTELPDTDAIIDDIENPLIATMLPTDIANSQSKNGEKLPLAWQAISSDVAKPVPVVTSTAIKLINNDVSVEGIDLVDVESDSKLSTVKLGDSDLVKADMAATDKMQIKQPVVEQMGAVIKDNPGFNTPQINSLTPVTPQNQLNPPLSSTLQTLQLSPQATSSQWGEALGEKVSLLLNSKLNSVEIRLDPPHLGKLDIQIQIKDDSAVIVINTQHAQTRDLIDSASVRLREFLQQEGFTSVDVDVSHQEQSMAQGDVSDHNNDRQGENGDQQNLSEQGELSELQQQQISLTVDDGRIDYFA